MQYHVLQVFFYLIIGGNHFQCTLFNTLSSACPKTNRKGVVVYVRNCNGTLECVENTCPFLLRYKRPNRFHFEHDSQGRLACNECCSTPKQVHCKAYKTLVRELGSDIISVIYRGNHLCTPSRPQSKPVLEEVAEIMRYMPEASPSKIRHTMMSHAVQKSLSPAKAGENIHAYIDKKAVTTAVHANRRAIRPRGVSTEAVRKYKEEIEEKGFDPSKGIWFLEVFDCE